MKTGMRLRPPIGGGVCRAEHNGKKCQKLWKGEVLPLDGSLLMGNSSVDRHRCCASRPPLKASHCSSPAARSRGLLPVAPHQACPEAPPLRPACSRQGARPAARRGVGETSGGLHNPEGAFLTGLWQNSV